MGDVNPKAILVAVGDHIFQERLIKPGQSALIAHSWLKASHFAGGCRAVWLMTRERTKSGVTPWDLLQIFLSSPSRLRCPLLIALVWLIQVWLITHCRGSLPLPLKRPPLRGP